MKPSGSTTLTAGAKPAPSTELPAAPLPGETVLVRLDQHVWRPLIITTVTLMDGGGVTLNGMLVVEPEDYLWAAFRGARFAGRIHSRRIDGLVFLAYAELLAEGDAIGEWKRRR